ncbi:Aromatic compound dioxygenase [Glarea lozoyensis ATCC 20868]|uniref:Aromatic compound dioxygenase n=1 Tax=Glarea lozoyensis (strain ATCC 20868 / MF5171) TaxID=1116229 RepID=S3D2B8_GLAL2|nr:Aromatic compound dioxygenase [Glarea lozoyensis ATCC 20868]EPE31970.1 Aromatic compound dioxygenase [Glarea lozoyensis ATCC 20868]
MVQINNAVSFFLLVVGTVAHPGADILHEIRERELALQAPNRRTVEDCRVELEASGYYKRELHRRLNRVNSLRAEKGSTPLAARDIDPYYAVEDVVGPRSEVDKRASCVLDPEVTEGPYWVAGELIRQDVTTGSKGIITHLDINVIDVSTCKPIPDIFVELWGCNSTGVYTGVVAKGNGVGTAAPEEIKNNALRGVQPTGANGTASFITIAPGHYVGRTNHLHTIIHHGATKLPNNTIQGGTISHVGQFYIEQAMMQTIEATAPYNTNKQAWTKLDKDMLFSAGKAGGDDPLLQIKMLGSSIEDGIYAYIDVGVNPKVAQKPSPVNIWGPNGGVPNKGSMWAGYPWTKKIRSTLGL